MVSIVGSTLVQLVSAIAPELGLCTPFTASSAGGGPTVVSTAALVDNEAPVEKYGGYYVYCTADTGTVLGQQNRVNRNGYTGATGTLTCSANFAGTAAAGSTWLLLGTMPVLDQDRLTGIRTCVNRAIRKLWMRYWYPFAAVSSQVSYDLGALWFATRSRFIRLMDPQWGGTIPPSPASQGWDVVQNADVWTLQLSTGYADGLTFWLVMDAPVNFRLKQSGTWTNQATPTAGLVLGADACLGSFNDVMQCSLYECFKQLALQAGGARKAYWVGRVAEQRPVVSAIKGFNLNDDGESLGEGPENSPGSWASVSGDKGFWSRW